MGRDPNLGRIISKPSGIMFWWDMRVKLPDGDYSWVDEPQNKDAKITLESDKATATKAEKIKD